jgi:hypothetical protein
VCGLRSPVMEQFVLKKKSFSLPPPPLFLFTDLMHHGTTFVRVDFPSSSISTFSLCQETRKKHVRDALDTHIHTQHFKQIF